MGVARDGRIETEGRLAALRSDETDRLRRLIKEAAETAAGRSLKSGRIVALHRAIKRPLSAVVAPMWGEAFDAGRPLPAALVFVRDPERRAVSGIDALKAMFGLTDAEARLAVAMAGGENLQDIADEHGFTVATAGTHVKRLMSKAGVNRQAELVLLILTTAGSEATGPALRCPAGVSTASARESAACGRGRRCRAAARYRHGRLFSPAFASNADRRTATSPGAETGTLTMPCRGLGRDPADPVGPHLPPGNGLDRFEIDAAITYLDSEPLPRVETWPLYCGRSSW